MRQPVALASSPARSEAALRYWRNPQAASMAASMCERTSCAARRRLHAFLIVCAEQRSQCVWSRGWGPRPQRRSCPLAQPQQRQVHDPRTAAEWQSSLSGGKSKQTAGPCIPRLSAKRPQPSGGHVKRSRATGASGRAQVGRTAIVNMQRLVPRAPPPLLRSCPLHLSARFTTLCGAACVQQSC